MSSPSRLLPRKSTCLSIICLNMSKRAWVPGGSWDQAFSMTYKGSPTKVKMTMLGLRSATFYRIWRKITFIEIMVNNFWKLVSKSILKCLFKRLSRLFLGHLLKTGCMKELMIILKRYTLKLNHLSSSCKN